MKRERMVIDSNIVLILRDVATGEVQTTEVKNIVTEAGDQFYAERAVEWVYDPSPIPAPTNAFDTIFFGSDGTTAPTDTDDFGDLTPITGAVKLVTTDWPKVNDQDVLNTGGGLDVISWKFEFLPADFEAPTIGNDIEELVIAEAAASGTDPILNRAVFSGVTKTLGQSLTAFVNHTLDGV